MGKEKRSQKKVSEVLDPLKGEEEDPRIYDANEEEQYYDKPDHLSRSAANDERPTGHKKYLKKLRRLLVKKED